MAKTTLLGDAFLTATIEHLLHKLSSSDFIEYVKYTNLNLLKLTVLETKLLALRPVLRDAEQKQFFNPKIKQWCDELYNTISTAEDLFDEIDYVSLRCNVENTQAGNDSMFNFQISMICQMLQSFVQQIDILGLGYVSDIFSPSNSVLNESVIVGRRDDKENLINLLMCESGNFYEKLDVIVVLGDGGVGKSTLVRHVYDDRKVDECFDLKVWVRVLEDFDVLRVTKVLYNSISTGIYVGKDLNHLRGRLKEELKCRRFLFVLDDVWNDDYRDWYNLITPLFNENYGSKVIITTRSEKVAEVAHTFPIHKLEPLGEEDCWSLFSKHAFGSGGGKSPNLEAIGMKIARKCGGLPIAAKTLGGL